MRVRVISVITIAFFLLITSQALSTSEQPTAAKRPMTFMDVINMRYVGSMDVSRDGKWLLCNISETNWEKGKRFGDIYLVSTAGGEARQMTFTEDKNEQSPAWYPEGGLFGFLCDREEKRQLYLMRPDGGEARRVTDDKEGVNRFEWSLDGKQLAYSAGKPEKRQIWLMTPRGGEAVQLTKHETPIVWWDWSRDCKSIYFTSPDQVDEDDLKRKEKGFDVQIVNQPKPPEHLWMIDLDTKEEKRLTSGEEYTVSSVETSKDGRWIAFEGVSTDRYAGWMDSELYLLDLTTGEVTQLTDNQVSEGGFLFSPDSRWLAFSADDEFTTYRTSKIYLLPVGGGEWRKLPSDFDYDVSVSFWGDDSQTIYSNTLMGVNYSLFAIPISGGKAKQITKENAAVFVGKDEDSGTLIISYSDPARPTDLYISSWEKLGDPKEWIQLTRSNPEVEEMLLGEYETIRWKSTDGKSIEGLLIKPAGFQQGERYPLIVQIHGGPASAYTNEFSDSYGTYVHIYAGNGYAVFQPNYRGSAGYGEKFRMEIAGDYFRQAFDDIITGVDYLIKREIADPDKLGMMGWSAGGHWSNWTLVSTDRFKAISTGAGAVNWISLYAQTDVQFTREFYFQGKPYDNWDDYVRVSPLKYIKKAKTPTLIHFGEKDQRIPKPQGDELHMALKKLGVPTEYIVYPNMPHGLSDIRYQMVKMQAEFSWFEKWIKGKEEWLDWKELLKTLKEEEKEEK
ncbi:MAG: S9 family peptidase [Candidatus Aminicenantes bacterium]|nr:S9 family peptidase [Candidatus Aminicenantes bacterium]